VGPSTKFFVDNYDKYRISEPMSPTRFNFGIGVVCSAAGLACGWESGTGAARFPAPNDVIDANPALRVAISVDDLPWSGRSPSGETAGAALQRIAAVLRHYDAPATGFVICDAANEDRDAIAGWIRSGFDVGNHSARHRDLNTTPLGEWLDDVRRCDAQLLEHGSAYTHYFRFPMLHQGATSSTRDAVGQVLRELGSSTAHVSVDTSEWLLADGYAQAVQRADAAAMEALGVELIRHVLATLDHADGVARRKLGRGVPLVLLIHANLLIADKLQGLLASLLARDVEFVSMREALADPVYALPDEYVGRKGMSWLYRIPPLDAADVAWDDREAEAVAALVARLLP
jgi:peptidoglycan-N-acetylglucosamine deacetylase